MMTSAWQGGGLAKRIGEWLADADRAEQLPGPVVIVAPVNRSVYGAVVGGGLGGQNDSLIRHGSALGSPSVNRPAPRSCPSALLTPDVSVTVQFPLWHVHFLPLMSMKESPSSAVMTMPVLVWAKHPF